MVKSTGRPILLSIFLMICCSLPLIAKPLKLIVEPYGTNQVKIRSTEPVAKGIYEVFARKNGTGNYWIQFAGWITDTNAVLSINQGLDTEHGLTIETLKDWKFVARARDDFFGDGFSSLYKELVLRADPFAAVNGYADLTGEGRNILQKMQLNEDPLVPYPSPSPKVELSLYQVTNNPRRGTVILSWDNTGLPTPDYFVIERALRTAQLVTNSPYDRLPTNWPPGTTRPWTLRSNWLSMINRNSGPPQRFQGTNQNHFTNPTNGPPFLPYNYPRSGYRGMISNKISVGPYLEVAKVPGRQGLDHYKFIDTNVDALFPPLYKLYPHLAPPLHATLSRTDTAGISNTLIFAKMQSITNGYEITISNPIPVSRYLLLLRDRRDREWRASGFFMSGTNRKPVVVNVNNKGMMTSAQGAVTMAEGKNLPAVINPEFAAGWGADSDGDGLPDIYEVLVTKTKPNDADTENTGVLDGFKENPEDGVNNLEKFRRRISPTHAAIPPKAIELVHPTGSEIIKALPLQTDLKYEIVIQVRTNGENGFQDIENVPWLLAKILNQRHLKEQKDFDVRISWRFLMSNYDSLSTERQFPAPEWYSALEPLLQRINIKLIEAFKSHLATNAPLSSASVKQIMATIQQEYRQEDADKGLTMAKSMLVEDNRAQDFYGKIIDQHGEPVSHVQIKAQPNLNFARGVSQSTFSDGGGLFQFTGLRGRSLTIGLEKTGYMIEGHGLGTKGTSGTEADPKKPEVYTMWKLQGPEPMIHWYQHYRGKPDNRIYTLDLIAKKIVEATNGTGDLCIQLLCPDQGKREEHNNYDWSYALTVMDGGLIEVSGDEYLNEAPFAGYQTQYKNEFNVLGSKRWNNSDEHTFYLKTRKGKVYGHMNFKITANKKGDFSFSTDIYINPSGSRNLEFDPSKEIH